MNKLRHLGFQILYLLAYVISLLPMSVLYVIARIMYVVMYHIIGYRRDVVIQNLSRSFPTMKYPQVKKVSKAFYINLTNYFAEILKSISAPLSYYKDKIEFRNFDIVKEHIAQGKTVLAGMGHVTNWEMLNVLPQMENIHAVAVYKTQASLGMNELMKKIRSRFGMKLITSTEVTKHLLKKVDTNAMYIFIADQSPMHNVDEDKRTFLHQETQMFNGMQKIGLKINAEIVYLKMEQTSRGRYTVTCVPLGNAQSLSAQGAIIDAYTHHLEENIQAYPSSWLWTHKRWKR